MRHISKESVNYREGTGDERCGNCVMFRLPHSCTLVRGEIHQQYVCDRWSPDGNTKR